jgi:hypothetical protein
MPESDDALKGNLHAIEYMLTQLYSMALLNVDQPQPWINENTVEAAAKIARSEYLNEPQKQAAYGTIRRVMQMVSWDAETQERGRALNLVTMPRPDEEA